MKKDAISTGLFIAIGFLCVAIVIAVLIPVVRDVINAADDNRPKIPAAMNIPAPESERSMSRSFSGSLRA
ncbi:hypothetical protein ACE6ED_11825 [Paenibacillus sp. CN-4]|uniref:hypothetical protein n=1 Tax=Paenibacillus nanchangensis TaxID=3348343 RepID=UPI00397D7937